MSKAQVYKQAKEIIVRSRAITKTMMKTGLIKKSKIHL